ncbi:outer membrane lipoprotein carrier protein LolA [Sphingobacterium sp. LRF_L2]|uniref:outer membrane lipoprotein carrier protein LolA n=1 Tax=Sphingobacterium sp. LRF_L2 TaxID=3369421 RepID=UPI003F62B764
MKCRLFFFLIYLMLFPRFMEAQTRPMTVAEKSTFQESLKKIGDIQTLSADFTQYKYVSFLKKPTESSGKLFLKHPDRLSWSYTTPFQYKMVLKDGQIQIDDNGKKKTLALGGSKQFEKMSKLISSSLHTGQYDEKEFVIAYVKKDGKDVVRLTPKTGDSKKYIKEILLVFSSQDHQVEEVQFIEPSDDYTRFVLKNRKVNTKLNESVFNL